MSRNVETRLPLFLCPFGLNAHSICKTWTKDYRTCRVKHYIRRLQSKWKHSKVHQCLFPQDSLLSQMQSCNYCMWFLPGWFWSGGTVSDLLTCKQWWVSYIDHCKWSKGFLSRWCVSLWARSGVAFPVWDVPVQLDSSRALSAAGADVGALPGHEEKVAAVPSLGRAHAPQRHRRWKLKHAPQRWVIRLSRVSNFHSGFFSFPALLFLC